MKETDQTMQQIIQDFVTDVLPKVEERGGYLKLSPYNGGVKISGKNVETRISLFLLCSALGEMIKNGGEEAIPFVPEQERAEFALQFAMDLIRNLIKCSSSTGTVTGAAHDQN